MNLSTAPTMSGSSTARQFQLVLCQSLLGLPLERLLDNHPKFGLWLSQIKIAHPEIWELPESQRATNYQLELDCAGQRFSSTLDLLLATSDSASIFRWSTKEPKLGRELLQERQTRLDLFLVAEKLLYQPEQVSLHYWFLGAKAISVSLDYNVHLHLSFVASLDSELDYTQLFLDKKISRSEYQQYIETLPEVEI